MLCMVIATVTAMIVIIMLTYWYCSCIKMYVIYRVIFF